MNKYCPVIFEELPSTNSFLLDAADKYEEGQVVIARRQTAGRGRIGKNWVSPLGNLYFSLLLKPGATVGEIPLLSQLFGLTVRDILLNEITDSSAHAASVPENGVVLKWPNDLLYNGKKCAGILIESRTVGEKKVIVGGIGINLVHMDDNAGIDQPYTSLSAISGRSHDPASVARSLFDLLMENYSTWLKFGFTPFGEKWASCVNISGRKIVFFEEGARKEGTIIAAFNDLTLSVDTGQKGEQKRVPLVSAIVE